MAIYTKKGDKGKSSVLDGKRIPKSSPIFEALGALDEVNSWLGVVGGFTKIQKDLIAISSILAGAKLDFPAVKTKKLELEIDKLETKLPILKGFIIPEGEGAKLHFARALIRRAERAVVSLHNSSFIIHNSILMYLNRLSDYFFMLAGNKKHFSKIPGVSIYETS